MFYPGPGVDFLPSHSQSTLPGRNDLLLESIDRHKDHFILWTRAYQPASCPKCNQPSLSYHGHYFRKLQDLPWQGVAVELRVRVRRFRCRNTGCSLKVFSEQIPAVVRPHARRTTRVLELVRLVGHTAGGLPGSRVLRRLAIPVSDDTVLRTVRRVPEW